MHPRCSSSAHVSKAEKRKSFLDRKGSQKQQRNHNNNTLIDFIKREKFSTETEHELKKLLVSGVDINEVDKTEDRTALLYCVIEQKLRWIPLLLKHGADPSFTLGLMPDGTVGSASDVAWHNENYDVAYQLIMADGPFPKYFDERILTQEQKKGVKELQNLHELIKANDIDKVTEFVQTHPHVKNAYNRKNQCALLAAWEAENYQIYSLLLSKDFVIAENDMKSMEKRVRKLCKAPNMYILDLVSKSRLGLNNDEKHFDDIKKYFEALDEIEDMKAILRIVATAQKLTISFDFNHDSVCGLDPKNPGKAAGRTYGSSERILIGAKRETECELLGTLAHELTHFAMYLIYNNNCLPYLKNSENEKTFKTVVARCHTLKEKNETIENVFANGTYNSMEIPIELIVRVPQLKVLNKNNTDELEKIRETFKVLFDFYGNCVLPDLKAEVVLIEPKQKVRGLNKMFGLFEIYSNEIFAKNLIINSQSKWLTKINRERESIFVETPKPELVMAGLTSNLLLDGDKKIVSSRNVFVKVSQPCNQKNYLSETSFIFNSNLNPTFYVLDSDDCDVEICKTVLGQLTGESKVVFVTNKPCEYFQDDFKCKTVDLKWNDLTEEAKLNFTLVFQGNEVHFEKIWPKDSEVLLNFPLDAIESLKTENLKISEKLPTNTLGMFVERSYELFENQHRLILNVDDVLRKLQEDGIVVLADSAGMGKTTSAIHIAETLKKQDPLNWVIFVDLKQHSAVYKEDKLQQELSVELIPQYLSEKLLGFGTSFEQKLFEDSYEGSKIFFIMDGIDEISPLFKSFVVSMLRHIQESGNLLLMTTRTHLAGELKETFQRTALKLKPFSKSDQIKFLMEFWQKKWPGMPIDELKAKAERLLEKFQIALNHRDFVEVPLQLYMIAEVYGDKTLNEFEMNLFLLYKEFATKKIQIWNRKGGVLVENDVTKIETGDCNLNNVHQNIAIECIFGKDDAEALALGGESEVKLDSELIMRVGLIKIILNGGFEFAHKTYAEFFIADYCYTKILNGRAAKLESDVFRKVLLEKDYESIRQLLFEKLRTVDSLTFGKFWNTIKKILADIKDQKTFLYFDCYGVIAFYIFTNSDVTVVLENIGNNLSASDFRSFLLDDDWLVDVLCYSTFGARVEVFSKLWNFIEKNFESKDDRKFLLLKKFLGNRNALVTACVNRTSATMRKAFSIASSLMEKTEFKNHLTTEDSFGFVAFHHSLLSENTSEYIKAFEEEFEVEFSKVEICSLLKQKFFCGRNITHVLACNSRDDKAWNFVIEHLEHSEPGKVKAMLTEKEEKNLSAFHKAAFFNRNFILTILEWFKSKSTAKELEDIFEDQENEEKSTLLHLIAKHCDETLAQNIFNFMSGNFVEDSNAIKKMLQAVDKYDNTPLHSAVFNKNRSTIHAFWNFYSEALQSSELKELVQKSEINSKEGDVGRQEAFDFLRTKAHEMV